MKESNHKILMLFRFNTSRAGATWWNSKDFSARKNIWKFRFFLPKSYKAYKQDHYKGKNVGYLKILNIFHK